LNGEIVRSCLTLAVQCEGAEIVTIEGLGDKELHPVQAAFWEHHGLQCGFCTPAMVLTSVDLIRRKPDLTEADVRETLSGNLCRCTGYQFIVDAVLAAARSSRAGQET
jgi:carbon-monoxide dehydrogenase small subunit